MVSGYFSFADTMHSLLPLLEKLFEESKITVESTFTTNEFKYAPALQLVDMILLYFLTDRREFFNDSVNLYNIGIHDFPNVILVKILGYNNK